MLHFTAHAGARRRRRQAASERRLAYALPSRFSPMVADEMPDSRAELFRRRPCRRALARRRAVDFRMLLRR